MLVFTTFGLVSLGETVYLKTTKNKKIHVSGRGDISHNIVLYLEVPFDL